MNLIKIFKFCSLLFFFLLSSVNVFAQQNFKFPKSIKYKIIKNDRIIGNSLCIFNSISTTNYLLIMKHFEGFGFESHDELYSFLLKKNNFVLERSFISKGRYSRKKHNIINELFVQEDISFFGIKNNKDINRGMVIKYCEKENEMEKCPFIHTEIDLDQYPLIDLLSSFIIISERVANDKYKKPEYFYFFISSFLYFVHMNFIQEEQIIIEGKKYNNTKVITLKSEKNKIKLGRKEADSILKKNADCLFNEKFLFTFYIYKDHNGYCYPAKIKFTNYNNYSLEFMLKKYF